MPNLTIYVDQELLEAVRLYKVPISLTCQRALRRQARIEQRKTAVRLSTADRQAVAAGDVDRTDRPAG